MKTTLRFFPAIAVRQLRVILLIMVFGFQGLTYLMAQTTCPSTYTLSGTTLNATTGTWTAPSAGTSYLIKITAAGAQGVTTSSSFGGEGALISGTFIINAGQQLDITAGGTGGLGVAGIASGGGGGGGSGVKVAASGPILIIAGGGGGGGGLNTVGGFGLTSFVGPNTSTGGNGGASGNSNAGGG
ncbi:MAG TPA: hypothetical protein VKR32_07450, partial [Puia sp.]|nr:hypothetical protein [Puia sp.]